MLIVVDKRLKSIHNQDSRGGAEKLQEIGAVSGQSDAAAMLSVVSRAMLGRGPKQLNSANGLHFTVDGVRIEVAANGPRAIRFSCTVLAELPERDSDLRTLMAQYLAYSDSGNDILCTDGDGRLMLIAAAGPQDDLSASVASFCDAAVHWTKMAERRREFVPPMRGPMMIFP
jgi:hypothetical protein